MKIKANLFRLGYTLAFIIAILFLVIRCEENTTTETEPVIPEREPGTPFYTGTIRFTQLPTSDNPDLDVIIDMNVTFEPDSNGYWPALYNREINVVIVKWGWQVCYEDSAVYDGYVNEMLYNSDFHTIDSLGLTSSKKIDRSYRFTIPSSYYSNYPQISEKGYLYIIACIDFEGKIVSYDSLHGLTYSCFEIIDYVPATGRITRRTGYTNIESPFTVIP
jgi:hypothetical protein